MVALRKDVKVGFVVGGIMLAVVGVYFALTAFTGKSTKTTTAETATLQVPPGDAPRTAIVTTPKPSTPARIDAPVAKADRPNAAAPSGAGDDVWSNAFTTGDLHPTRSVTPDLPTKTSREPAAKPSDVIRALNNPSDAGTTAPQSTANAADDSSGAMAGGTTSTMTRAADDSTKKPLAGDAKTHVVVSGETFSAIAEEEYGSPTLYKLIVDANPNVDPGKLKVGQSLAIPPHDKATPAASAAKTTASVDAAKQYVVKPGDSLHRIASTLYGSSSEWQAIYDANKSQIGESPANIKVGMTLTLPKPPMKK